MSGSYNVQPSERTEIIRGRENVIDAVLWWCVMIYQECQTAVGRNIVEIIDVFKL